MNTKLVYSSPSSDEDKNVWMCTSTPTIHHHGVALIKQEMRFHGMVLA